ncbi:beta-lactamase family protein [Chitinophagaceae bacterium LB-8]|uniref:Beta-lactamase family protein n=1 Tax=Paraflavisolibacter caeni TaxID=2982496 RepID=A0A9X2XZ71_9BACT|nr:beta-lactamase family protein [Paraflavisolibacter caeni]MCU7551387.1 beta-lactamase family protein [Paraflavisolibacter caeni]
MKRYLILTFLIAATNIVFGQIPIDSIKAIIKQEVANKRSKSIIVGIVDANGRQIFAEGKLSDRNPTLPDGNTIYEIGSITKVFTSLLLADMSLKQQLNLNDPISKFLPKTVKTPIRNGKEISLLSLSTHRSGMPRFPYNVDPKNLDNPYADYTVSQLYEYTSNFKPDFDIDSKWRYSNIGYGLLGNILATVAQKNFETLVKQEICKPLNMNSTVISLTAKLKSNIALGHTEFGEPTVFTDLPALEGAGALRSNVNDLLTFAEANLGLVKTDLLPAMELTHILQAKKDGNDTYTTMGWTLSNDDGKYHLFKDGGTAGYRTFLGIDKKNKIGVIVLSNSNNSVTDIGWHILDPTHKVEPYKYPWALLDTLRTTIQTTGVDVAIELYQQLKASKNASFIFNENQLNYLGDELRRHKRIKEAIKIYELNLKEYPKSTLVYESLGETYKRNKNKKLAIKYFEKAFELDSQNPHWTYILEKLKSG